MRAEESGLGVPEHRRTLHERCVCSVALMAGEIVFSRTAVLSFNLFTYIAILVFMIMCPRRCSMGCGDLLSPIQAAASIQQLPAWKGPGALYLQPPLSRA